MKNTIFRKSSYVKSNFKKKKNNNNNTRKFEFFLLKLNFLKISFKTMTFY